MGLQPVQTATTGGIPVWQKVLEVMAGGFTLATTNLTLGNKLVPGTPLLCSETARTATVVKSASVQATATDSATAYRVLKGHHFKVGDYIGKTVGGAAYAISEIDATNAAYDVLTVGTTLGVALAVGDCLFQSSAEGAAACAMTATPNALLDELTTVAAMTGVNGVVRGTIYERRSPVLHADWKTALKGILFSKTY